MNPCNHITHYYFYNMALKNGIFILALWTLLLGPTLCGLGVLVHSCLDDKTDACHTEVQCSTDPCQILVIKTTEPDEKIGDGGTIADDVVTPSYGDAMEGVLPGRQPRHDALAENPSHTPAFGQTLPLLC